MNKRGTWQRSGADGNIRTAFFAITPIEVLLIGIAASAAGLFAFAWISEDPKEQTSQLKLSSSPGFSTSDERSSSVTPVYSQEPLQPVNSFSASSMLFAEPTEKVYPSLEVARQELAKRGIYQAETEPEIYRSQMPLAFLNHASVIPATEEAVAAIQQMQRDFVDSIGAGATDPADPDYAYRWDQFQNLLDEQFCAIFGAEACNAMSIERRRELGHF